MVLCSRNVHCRPWCVGEMTTARLHCVTTILVVFPDFLWPSSEFVEQYAAHAEGILSLAVHGISVQMAQETLRCVGESSPDCTATRSQSSVRERGGGEVNEPEG